MKKTIVSAVVLTFILGSLSFCGVSYHSALIEPRANIDDDGAKEICFETSLPALTVPPEDRENQTLSKFDSVFTLSGPKGFLMRIDHPDGTQDVIKVIY